MTLAHMTKIMTFLSAVFRDEEKMKAEMAVFCTTVPVDLTRSGEKSRRCGTSRLDEKHSATKIPRYLLNTHFNCQQNHRILQLHFFLNPTLLAWQPIF